MEQSNAILVIPSDIWQLIDENSLPDVLKVNLDINYMINWSFASHLQSETQSDEDLTRQIFHQDN